MSSRRTGCETRYSRYQDSPLLRHTATRKPQCPPHIHAYAYLSRATHGQAIDEVSLQVQLARIEKFVKSYNIPNRKVFRQTRRTGHTEEALTQTAFESAIAAAKRTSGFIVVSSLDRLERNSRPYIDFVSGGGMIVAVDEGFGVHESDVRDLAAKAAVVSKRIADQARLGRESALERGVTFGNPRVRDAGLISRLWLSSIRGDIPTPVEVRGRSITIRASRGRR
jgi:hypothetical protein